MRAYERELALLGCGRERRATGILERPERVERSGIERRLRDPGRVLEDPVEHAGERRPIERVQLGEAHALDRQRHDREAVDVDEPEVGDLERRDHREREEAQRHERRDDRDAQLGEQALAASRAARRPPRPAGPRAGPRRAAAARRGRRRRVHDDPAADLSEAGDRERHVVRRRRRRTRCCARRGRPSSRTRRAAARSPRTNPTPTRPVAWWRSTTAILARSRAGSATATPCCDGRRARCARRSGAARGRSRSRAPGWPVDGNAQVGEPDRRRVHRLAHPDGHLGSPERRDDVAVEDERAVLVDAARAEGHEIVEQHEVGAVARRDRAGVGEPVVLGAGAATRAAARPRARCPRRPPSRHIWSMWPSRTRKSGSRSSVQNAQRSGPYSRTSGSSAAGCGRSRPRGSAPRRPCGASRGPPRRSSPRDPTGSRRPGRRSARCRARPARGRRRASRRAGRACAAPSDRRRSRPGSSSSRRRPAPAGGAAPTRGRPTRQRPARRLERARRARTTAPSRRRRAARRRRRRAASGCRRCRARWRSRADRRRPRSCRARAPTRANSSTISLDDSMCTCASMNPGTR